jgi:hypothetical protein
VGDEHRTRKKIGDGSLGHGRSARLSNQSLFGTLDCWSDTGSGGQFSDGVDTI